MKYKIGDYSKINNQIIKIIDFEKIDNFTIYYFSDGTSKEETQFNILSEGEAAEYCINKIWELHDFRPGVKRLSDAIAEWLREKERIKKESSLIFKIKKFFKNI